MRAPAKAVLSVFGVGFLPYAPGTAASGVAILAHWCIFQALDGGAATAVSLGCGVVFAAATLVWGGKAEADGGSPDPGWVVSDEVAGQLLVAAGLAGPLHLVQAFVVFRILDVAKPFPIGILQKLPGGWGILADDLAAAAASAGLVRLVMLFF